MFAFYPETVDSVQNFSHDIVLFYFDSPFVSDDNIVKMWDSVVVCHLQVHAGITW